MSLRNETTDTNDRDSTPPPSGPLPGRLSLEERVRRSEALERASRQRDAHALDKTTWTKAWKRKDEYLAELIARLTREAGTGVDEGQQLTIEGTDTPPLPPIEVLSGRWAELVKISPPRISAWTLQEADLSPVAKKLLERLKPKETLGRPASVTLELGDLPELLGCTAVESLDAVAELLCVKLANLRGNKHLFAIEIKPGLLRLDSWKGNDVEVGLDVLHEMLRTELDDVHPDYLLLGAKLPRRALLPLLEGLKAIGAVTSTEKGGWRRVARVPVWEKLVLEALARAEGVRYQAERALTGCLNFDWTLAGLVEAGVIKKGSKSEVSGQVWQLVPEADRQPLSLEDVVAMVRRKAPKEGSKEAAPLQQIVSSLELQAPTVRRACEALVAEGWLVEAPANKHYGGHYYGPWYARAKADKKAKTKGKEGKAEKKTPAKPATTTTSAKKSAKPLMALGDRIDLALRSWGTWYDEKQLQAQIREEEPLNKQHSDRDWRGVLKDMLRSKRLESREENGRTQLRTYPSEAASPAPPKGSPQERTAPLFPDVEPAPASSEFEEEASEP